MARKIRLGLILVGVLSSVFVFAVQDYPTISYRDAEDHIDEIVWVEGKILRTEKAREGEYLLFNGNEKYLRVLIPSADIKNFEGSIKYMYVGETVKAIGKIVRYGPTLILGVNEPKRIRIVEDESN